MELCDADRNAFGQFMGRLGDLSGDKRTRYTVNQTVQGILGGQSLRCAQIARSTPGLSGTDSSEQRIRDMVSHRTTHNSPDLDERHIVQRLVQRGVELLSHDDDIWVALDSSDLRKPSAYKMPDLMEVRALDKRFVPGYRVVTALGVGKGVRSLLYHHLFSSEAADFTSEPREVTAALTACHTALRPLAAVTTFLMDSGFDSAETWSHIWQQGDHLVCRLCQLDRWVTWRQTGGRRERVQIQNLTPALRPLASVTATMEVRKVGEKRAHKQQVTARVSSVPVTVSSTVLDNGKPRNAQHCAWIVQVVLEDTTHDPWWLLTDWPVETEADAVRIFRMYCTRWAVEDSYKFVKQCFGWEEVQMRDLEAIRVLVALAWVAAAFLYEMGVTWDWVEVQLLARLGGYVPHKGRKPGKQALCRGLQRLYESFATLAFLEAYKAEHGDLPPRIKALVKGLAPAPL